MKLKLILMCVMININIYSQIKTFAAVNILDSLALGGSEYMDTVINIADILPPVLWKKTNGHLFPQNITDSVGIGIDTPNALFQVKDLINFEGTSTILGQDAGKNAINSARNIFIGKMAARDASCRRSIIIGFGSGMKTKGTSNTYIGYASGSLDTSGSYNAILGSLAAVHNLSGSENVCVGHGSGAAFRTADANVYVGVQAGASSQGDHNTALGYAAGRAGLSGNYNVFVGNNAGGQNAQNYNTFVGSSAGANNTTGNGTFIGYQAGAENITGQSNVYVGLRAGGKNYTGNNNTYIGYLSGYNGNTSDNTCVGFRSGMNSIQNGNTYIGTNSGVSNSTGSANTYIGNNSGVADTQGSRNVYIGNDVANSQLTGNDNIYIGNDVASASTSGFNNVYIGSSSANSNTTGVNNVYIGFHAGFNSTSSGELIIENSSSSTPLIHGDFYRDYLKFNTDSLDYINSVAQYHKLDSLAITTADTWQSIKLDTNIALESTYGFGFNADSTGIIISTKGIFRIQGCVHWHYNGSDLTRVKLYVRVLIDGVEARCLQSNGFKDRRADDYGTQPFTGTVNATYGSEIKLQVRVSDTDMVLKGDNVYDNPVAASINLEKISFK